MHRWNQIPEDTSKKDDDMAREERPVAIKCKHGFFTCSCGDNGDVSIRLKPAPPCSFTAKLPTPRPLCRNYHPFSGIFLALLFEHPQAVQICKEMSSDVLGALGILVAQVRGALLSERWWVPRRPRVLLSRATWVPSWTLYPPMKRRVVKYGQIWHNMAHG